MCPAGRRSHAAPGAGLLPLGPEAARIWARALLLLGIAVGLVTITASSGLSKDEVERMNSLVNNLLNVNPKFKRSPENAADKYDYRLDTLSPASNKARIDALVPRDLVNKARSTTAPDLGAYERVNP